jgi:hypothetical protein
LITWRSGVVFGTCNVMHITIFVTSHTHRHITQTHMHIALEVPLSPPSLSLSLSLARSRAHTLSLSLSLFIYTGITPTSTHPQRSWLRPATSRALGPLLLCPRETQIHAHAGTQILAHTHPQGWVCAIHTHMLGRLVRDLVW